MAFMNKVFVAVCLGFFVVCAQATKRASLVKTPVIRWSRGSGFFDVTGYGAKPDGRTESSKGKSKVFIPAGTFFVGPIDFEGPCPGAMPEVQIMGTLKAPEGLDAFPKGSWITFGHIDNLKVSGFGVLDAQGAKAWRQTTCPQRKKCKNLPITLELSRVLNTNITGITLKDGKGFNMAVHKSKHICIDHIHIKAPPESPNTDGIHVSGSDHVSITNAQIGVGDDCVSVGQGTTNLLVSQVTCGPGHGISIGSLGKYRNEADVVGVIVRNCTLKGTTNGLRIKTWPGAGPSQARNFIYDNIVMDNASRVSISDVLFNNVRGTSASLIAVNFMCSSAAPCKSIRLSNINLRPIYGDTPTTSSCKNALGRSLGKQQPDACI
ncbi:Exopolygalacturonase [Acorus calamus]|uniref:Exopolygalacturonase n=1 Tax=Acorus calamus TaxID=4465 RepID=A0AAV9CYG1_ACOCL|nr:Exopolygalacturonase [Acorus calamus]